MFNRRIQRICNEITACAPGISFPVFDGQKEATDTAHATIAPAFQVMHRKVFRLADHGCSDADTFSRSVKEIKSELDALEEKIRNFRSVTNKSDRDCNTFGNRLFRAQRPLREQGKKDLEDEAYAVFKEYGDSTTLMFDAHRAFNAALRKEEEYLEKALNASKNPDTTPAQRTACIAEWASYVAQYDLSVEADIFSASSSAETVPVSMKIIDSVNKELFPAIIEIRHMMDSYDERFMICFDEAAVAFLEKMQKHLAVAQNKMEDINRLENDYFAAVQRHKLYLDEVRSKLGCDHGTVRKLRSSQELLDERCRKVAEATKIVRDLLPLQKDFIEKQLAAQERLRLDPVSNRSRAALLNMLIPRSKSNGAGAAPRRFSP